MLRVCKLGLHLHVHTYFNRRLELPCQRLGCPADYESDIMAQHNSAFEFSPIEVHMRESAGVTVCVSARIWVCVCDRKQLFTSPMKHSKLRDLELNYLIVFSWISVKFSITTHCDIINYEIVSIAVTNICCQSNIYKEMLCICIYSYVSNNAQTNRNAHHQAEKQIEK